MNLTSLMSTAIWDLPKIFKTVTKSHFCTNGEYPMPTLTHHWTRTRLLEASTWILPYQRRFDEYEEYIESTCNQDYMDLSD
ncbi:hypothetical protein OSB04_032031 [Centaurea solstitialis]|uniref:Uncharacterized protein n=1 Tax=Centaurea solstitialis TaxID=347529 RepID=A0AA38SI59_9ASTR|nr:hypothetical protein OSB04_032031 [Centaurea solstitialis]